jgi:hypothetical protein
MAGGLGYGGNGGVWLLSGYGAGMGGTALAGGAADALGGGSGGGAYGGGGGLWGPGGGPGANGTVQYPNAPTSVGSIGASFWANVVSLAAASQQLVCPSGWTNSGQEGCSPGAGGLAGNAGLVIMTYTAPTCAL